MAENIFYEKVTDEILAKAAENVEVDSCNVERKENCVSFLILLFLFSLAAYTIYIIKQIKKPKPCFILS